MIRILLLATVAIGADGKGGFEIGADGVLTATLLAGESLVAPRACVVGCAGAGGRGRLLRSAPLLAPGGATRWWRRLAGRGPPAAYTTYSGERDARVLLAPSKPGHGAAIADVGAAPLTVRAEGLICAGGGATVVVGAGGARSETTVAGGAVALTGPGAVVREDVDAGDRLDVLAGRCVAWTGKAGAGAGGAVAPARAAPFWRRRPRAPDAWRTFDGPCSVFVASASSAPRTRVLVQRPLAPASGPAAALKRLARRTGASALAAALLFVASLILRPSSSLADAPAELRRGATAAAAAFAALRRIVRAISSGASVASDDFRASRPPSGEGSGGHY